MPLVVLAMLVSMAVVLLTADLPASSGGRVAVIFDPAITSAEAFRAIAAAGGLPLRGSRLGNVVLAVGPETGFAGRLREGGAWLVVDARAFPGCGGQVGGRTLS